MMWQKAHLMSNQSIDKKSNIEEIIKMNHSKTIAKVLSDIKLKILLYVGISAVYIGLMLYAFVYLRLNLSLVSILPFSLAGLFFLIQITTEINRLLVLTKNSDNLSVKESLLYFRKILNRMKIFDFLSYLILLYTAAIWIILEYTRDIGGFQNLSGTNAMPTFILFLILILLLTPWFIKYQNNLRYKKIFSDLKDSTNLLSH